MKLAFVLPLIIFGVIAGFLLAGLDRDPGLLPSVLIDKPAPAFTAPLLPGTAREATNVSGEISNEATGEFAPEQLAGHVWVLNIWASWCVACVAEHKVITQLTEVSTVPVIGLNYKDIDADAAAWLQRFGNPYDHVPTDADGRIGIDFGVYGVPETYIVDKAGKIRYKHVGPVDQSALEDKLLPLIEQLKAANS